MASEPNEAGPRRLHSEAGQPRRAGMRMGQNLASIVTQSAARAAEARAVRLGGQPLTCGDLDDASALLATLLREHGLEPGDRVGVMLPNVLEFPIVYYGVLRAGGIAVPMNVLLKKRGEGRSPTWCPRTDPPAV